MTLSDLSIKRPVLMTMVVFTFVVIGLFSVSRLGIDLFPRIDFPFISIVTVYPGAGPEEIETLLNEPLEEEASSVAGVKNVYSTAQEGVSIVFVELQLGQDVDIASIDVKDKIDAIRRNLPSDIEPPMIQKFDFSAMPIVNLSVTGTLPLEELNEIADKTIKPELLKIPGLANIAIVGSKVREIQVELSAQLLRAYQISPMQVVMALATENLTLPAGRIERGREEYTLRLDGEFDSVEEIAATRINTPSGPIRLDRIGRVFDGFEEQREMARFNDSPSIGMDVIKRSDANTVEVADGIKQTIAKIQPLLPEGAKVDVANDGSQFIRDSVADVTGNLVLGVLFTALVLFLFLHNWRGTVIAALAMPISIVSTFTLLEAADFTLNVMSLMGLAISVGILVVNAIVVLENIERLRGEGLSMTEAAAKGTNQIALAVAAATLTNIVVFTPMAFLQGMIGPIFRQFGLTVAFATIFSLLISFTLTPMMASRRIRPGVYVGMGLATFLAVWSALGLGAMLITAAVIIVLAVADRLGGVKRFGAWWDRWYDELAKDYGIGLRWALGHRRIVLGAITLLFVFGLFLFGFIGSEFFPDYDERVMQASVEMPAGARVEETNRVLYRIERELARYPEIKDVYTSVGKSTQAGFGGGQGVQYGSVLATLHPRDGGDYRATSDIVKDLRVRLADIPAAKIVVSEATQFGGGGSTDIEIQLQGKRMENLEIAANKTVELIQSTGQAVDVRSDWVVGKPEIVVRPDRMRLSDRGVSVQDVAMVLRTFFEGTIATKYREEGDEYDVRVRLQEADRSQIERVGDLLIPTMSGFVPLKDVATVSFGSGPTQISRKNKQRMVTVSANAVGTTVGQLQQKITQVLQLPQTPASQVMKDILTGTSSNAPKPSPLLPDGVTVYFGGEAESMAESFTSLLQALVLSIILTYMLLAAILESYRFPVIIMMTLPLALIGVSMALVMTGKSISIFSMMSIIMLVGIVVNNGILLIDYTQELRQSGKGVNQALLEACPVRLRPILMSTMATTLGMMPLALGIGAGGEFRAPMAIVAIGGLIVSTALTLFVIPVMFSGMETKLEKFKARS